MWATLATKRYLGTQNLSQISSATRIKSATYLWPCTCHPKLLSNLFSILVLRLSERASPSELCCGNTRCTHNHLVMSHATIMRIPVSGTVMRWPHPGHGH